MRNESPAVSTSRPPKRAARCGRRLRALPRCASKPRRPPSRANRGVDDVGEQDRGHHASALARLRVESSAPSPVDHHQLLVALHPGDVAGWQVEHLVRPDHHLFAIIGPDAHPSREDHTAVIQLARGGTDLRLGVFLPAPARLQDMAGDHCSGQAYLELAPSGWLTTASGSPRSRTSTGLTAILSAGLRAPTLHIETVALRESRIRSGPEKPQVARRFGLPTPRRCVECPVTRTCGELADTPKWRGPDLNRRHHGFQPCALPTELPRRTWSTRPRGASTRQSDLAATKRSRVRREPPSNRPRRRRSRSVSLPCRPCRPRRL